MERQSLGLPSSSTALPSIAEARLGHVLVRVADVLLVAGGDARTCATGCASRGLTELVTSLPAPVWVGPERRNHGDDPTDR